MSEKPKILHIATGGTIAMAKTPDGSMAPFQNAEELLAAIPQVREIADVHMVTLPEVDSSNISPEYWMDLARIVAKKYTEFDGFVITHGTDTMAYTASALAFMLQELDKPVAITGSQVAIGILGSDGPRNLINAFRVAASDCAEVVVVFGSRIIRGVRARKISAFAMEAFESINENPLGEIGISMRISRRAARRTGKRLLFTPTLDPLVAMATVYPGMEPALLEHMVATHHGLVLLGFGTGNIPTEGARSLRDTVRKATQNGIPVVVGTQCVLGSTNLGLYRVGKDILEAGAIPSVDMTPEATLVKLMWVLGQTRDMDRISSMMLKPYAGEIAPYYELEA